MRGEDYSNDISVELKNKVKLFFEVYDPERLESSDFNILLRYIANRGIEALEDKLMRKYGVNIASMQEEEEVAPPRPLPEVPVSNYQETGSGDIGDLDDLPEPEVVSIVEKPESFMMAPENPQYRSITMNAGVNPNSGKTEDPERALMFQRLTNFYKEHNIDKLKGGIGNVVDYAMKHGEGRINAKLMGTYGEDLPMFEKRKHHSKRRSQTYEHKEMLQEEQEVTQMDPERQELRQKLISFFLVVEPKRAELKMDVLLDYANNNGLSRLNGKLFNKYGYNLDTVPTVEQLTKLKALQTMTRPEQRKTVRLNADLSGMKEGDLPDYVRVMLGKYYVKFDQMMLEDGGVEKVYEWTKRNGLQKLNRKLRERYGLSFQDFVKEANEMRDDLIEFYRHRDKNKLVIGIQNILDWGLRNGRQALNEKLRSKYGIGLDPDNDLYEDVMESASQF